MILPPVPGGPPRPLGPRDPGDAWVIAPTGERYWGRFGAAGLLALDPARGVLLQHRVSWSHFGDTWALPGGARHENESARDAALREAAEEAGVPATALVPRLTSVLDLGVWTYTTLVGDVSTPFVPVISDPESHALEWVPVADVDALPLHPGFAASWVGLRELLPVRPALVIDVANVMGAVPDGWWKDRAGAAERLIARLEMFASEGMDATALGLAGTTWYPQVVAVIEGAVRALTDPVGPIRIVRAAASGDDAIVAETASLVAAGRTVTVVTSDRGLTDRVTALGATVRGAGWGHDHF